MSSLYKYNRALSEAIWWNLLLLTIGAFLFALGVNAVIQPHGMLSGGLMGIALLISYAVGGLPVLLWYLLLCLPVYVAAWFVIGRRFLAYTIYGTLMTTLFGSLIHFTIPLSSELYAAIVGGAILGTGSGIMLRSLGSSGGTDIIAVALKERWNIPVGQFNFFVNMLIFLAGGTFMSLDAVIVSIIMMFISSSVLEYVLGMFNQRKLVMIISENGEAITEAILVSQRFGATLLRGKGAYSGNDREVLVTVTTNMALKNLEHIVFSIDPHALFIVENTFYVSGGQFARKPR
ncbi:MAG: YitT family protein [Desulfovibrionaceae bacterium]|nr:YitT family protein [Desulfovibrionaceae bacterium]